MRSRSELQVVCARSYDRYMDAASAPHQFGLSKIFVQSLKFEQTLFVVSMLIRYYQINQSINVSRDLFYVCDFMLIYSKSKHTR